MGSSSEILINPAVVYCRVSISPAITVNFIENVILYEQINCLKHELTQRKLERGD